MSESENLVELTDSNFQTEVLESNLPVVVDFWAEWCGPCQMMKPVFEELSKEYVSKVKFGKMDVDTYQKVATQYGIRSIPTLLFFKDGKVISQVVGMTNKKSLKEKIEEILS